MTQPVYTPFTTPRLDRDKLDAYNTLRSDHFSRLSRNQKGVLRDLTIGVANLYSTYDFNLILEIFADNQESKVDFSSQSMAQRIAHTGAMVIPYPDYNQGPDIGKRNWRRMRTDLVQSKYLSPLGKYSPPYRVLGFDHADTIDVYKQALISEVATEQKIQPNTPEYTRFLQTANNVFGVTQIDKLKGSYQNPSIPIIVVEGEFKALAILDAVMDKHKEVLTKCVESDDPAAMLHTLNRNDQLPPLVTCAGIGGVWNMVTKDKDAQEKKYVVRSEWSDNINLQKREVLICFDSDSKWLVGVGHAASSLAAACKPFKSVIKYISIPSPRGAKLGADDYIQAYGPNAFLQTVGEAKPIAAGVTFNSLKAAMRSGQSPIDYCIDLHAKEQDNAHSVSV